MTQNPAPKIGILSSQKGWHVTSLEKALLRQGAEACFFPIHRMSAWMGGYAQVSVNGLPLEECQALLVRTIPIGSLEQIIFRMDALHRLENLGIPIMNSPAAIERTVDKYYTDFLLRDAGIPTPRTFVSEDFAQALDAFREMGGDVIVKPLFGSEGKGMRRVNDEDTAYRVFRSLELDRYIFYLQEYIPHGQEDIRAFVVGDRVVAAMRRRGNGWKTNFAQGAKVEPVELSQGLKELSVESARLVGADYAGVDLLPAEDGRIFVLEVNSIPGWRGLRKTISFDIADVIIENLLCHLKNGAIAD
ncbi:MAG TPA: RimK family alpha-L-glutamate ligase [Anaerolineaceae bacterium]|nr:RimK family alpha-L-glutamate ligase [Anaerolineaceae bacterium]